MRIHYAISLLLILLTLSCEHTSYDTGDGKYSHLQSDYVSVEVKDCYVQSITTDEDSPLNIKTGMRVDVEPKDTTLRWLLYYNSAGDGGVIDIVGRNTMTLLEPKEKSLIGTMKTDPVKLISVWVANNKKYLNMHLGLMMGNSETENSKHVVGLSLDDVHDDTAYYTFYHDQSGIDEYYTQDVYLTMKCPEQKTIDLTINTYNGTWHKQFTVNNSQFTVK